MAGLFQEHVFSSRRREGCPGPGREFRGWEGRKDCGDGSGGPNPSALSSLFSGILVHGRTDISRAGIRLDVLEKKSCFKFLSPCFNQTSPREREAMARTQRQTKEVTSEIFDLPEHSSPAFQG